MPQGKRVNSGKEEPENAIDLREYVAGVRIQVVAFDSRGKTP